MSSSGLRAGSAVSRSVKRRRRPVKGVSKGCKRAFLATVDESVSGERIAGNPYKFVGTRVDLHCVISDIPQEDFVNATRPPDEYGLGPNVVIRTDARGLEKGQSIRAIGTVEDPMEGTNAMGGQMRFPTVKAEFME